MKGKSQRGSGTTSKILWHFTGGPRWNSSTGKQEKKPRPNKEALSSLNGILSSNIIRSSSHQEYIRYKLAHDAHIGLPIQPFCCVAEIPIQHLSFHSNRYGKFAIGFEREYLLGKRFRPVEYFLDDQDFMTPAFLEVYKYIYKNISSDDAKKAMGNLGTLGAFIKSFTKEEFDTVYSEREWRWLKRNDEFSFSSDAVKFVLAPKRYTKRLRKTYSQIFPEANFLEYELLLEH